jgi:hypothetical protein
MASTDSGESTAHRPAKTCRLSWPNLTPLYSNDFFHAGQHLHLLDGERAGVADEIDLGQGDLGPDFPVDPVLDAGQAVELPGEHLEIGTLGP